MTSKIGQIQDLSIFDDRAKSLTLCSNHQIAAQRIVAKAVDELFINNTLFHDLFEGVISKTGKTPFTINITYESLQIKQDTGQTYTLEFDNLGDSDLENQIKDKSFKVLQKIDKIYQRCVKRPEEDHTTARPLSAKRISRMDSPRSNTRTSPRSHASSQTRRFSDASRRSDTSTTTNRSSSTQTLDAGSEIASDTDDRSSVLSTSSAPASTKSKRHKSPARQRRSSFAIRDASTFTPGSGIARISGKTAKAATSAHKATQTEHRPRKLTHVAGPAASVLPKAAPVTADASVQAAEAASERIKELETTSARTSTALVEARAHIETQAKVISVFQSHVAEVAKRTNEGRLAQLTSYLLAANVLDSLGGNEIPDELKAALTEELNYPVNSFTAHSIFRTMYFLLMKKANEAEPETEERWETGRYYFMDDVYLGVKATNHDRAMALRIAVLEELDELFKLPLNEEASAVLIRLYDLLPKEVKDQIEGCLWQVKGSRRDVVSDYGFRAFHNLDGEAATNIERARAIRDYITEAIARY